MQDVLNLLVSIYTFILEVPKTSVLGQDVIKSIYDTMLTSDPVLCLLGYINSNTLENDEAVVIMRMLFLASKLIASWMGFT